MHAPATIRSINGVIASVSGTSAAQNDAHRGRDARPLPALRGSLAAPLGRQAVVLAPSARFALAPRRGEEARALHLMQGRIDGALFQLEGLRAAALGLLHHFIGVHRAL